MQHTDGIRPAAASSGGGPTSSGGDATSAGHMNMRMDEMAEVERPRSKRQRVRHGRSGHAREEN
eukprot:5103018-Prymnesium_polylepis.1